jgi:LmbE family N-acetylglucosaminyl deacetylase
VTGLVTLIVGAHPDDVEIGAGVLIQRLIRAGHEVSILILTDEPGSVDERRREARSGALTLGVPADRLFFAGLHDGSLRVDRETVGALRTTLRSADLRPHVVVTHSSADSHNDHSNANALVRATFRKSLLLFYSIHISFESNRFNPRFFVDTSNDDLDRKLLALEKHGSQSARLQKNGLSNHEGNMGQMVGLARSEAFEVDLQVGHPEVLDQLMELNESPMHRLWFPVIGADDVYLLYGEHPLRSEDCASGYSGHRESEGRDWLRDRFTKAWPPRSPLYERYASTSEAERAFLQDHVILTGNAASNSIIGERFNHLSGVDWIAHYGRSPDAPAHLYSKRTGRQIHPEYRTDGRVHRDVAAIGLMKNPASGRSLVSCFGVHGLGTQGILRFLAHPESNSTLLERIVRGGLDQQIVLTVDRHDLQLAEVESTALPHPGGGRSDG